MMQSDVGPRLPVLSYIRRYRRSDKCSSPPISTSHRSTTLASPSSPVEVKACPGSFHDDCARGSVDSGQQGHHSCRLSGAYRYKSFVSPSNAGSGYENLLASVLRDEIDGSADYCQFE